MSETEGLMAQATIDSGEDNQQAEQETISHLPNDDLQAANTSQPTEDADPAERPDWFPEKFWNDGPDIENLVKSYSELQKKFSQGKHKAPEQYDDSILRDANIADDDELATVYKDWAKRNGISQDAFEELAQQFVQMAGAEAEAEQVSYQEEYAKLGANADQVIKSMTEWAQSLVRKGVWSEDDFNEFKIMGGTAQGLKALQKIRSYYGDRAIPVSVEPVDGLPSKEELTAMVAKPEYATDPSYRAKVEKYFDQIYGKEDYSPI